jgi:hypothetical protein
MLCRFDHTLGTFLELGAYPGSGTGLPLSGRRACPPESAQVGLRGTGSLTRGDLIAVPAKAGTVQSIPTVPLAQSGKRTYPVCRSPPATDMERVTLSTLIETDGRSRAVIPGHMNQRFLLQENEDGSLLLQPASVVTDAQLEYDGDPELRALLARAAQSSTVHRSRQRRQG